MTVKLNGNQFLVDKRGRPQAVIVPLAAYHRLMRLLEDRKDALTLKQAIRTSRGVLTYQKLIERLKRQQLI